MYKTLEYTITGVSPTILHNGRLANPLDPMAKLLKEATRKRVKSDDDHVLIGDIEWLAAFYPSEPGDIQIKGGKLTFTGFGAPSWPGENIERMLRDAAATQRLSKLFKSSVMCDGLFPIEFGERKNIEQIFHDSRYVFQKPANVQGKTVIRTRPIFNEWKLKLRVNYEPNEVNAAQVDQIMDIAGSRIGLSDFRPKYGRFIVS